YQLGYQRKFTGRDSNPHVRAIHKNRYAVPHCGGAARSQKPRPRGSDYATREDMEREKKKSGKPK
ncbi:MAG: hypothetical protein KDK37_15655, partial [Leptospiraceae bacterium]|nr:hypothetical protein [Leptospiraceae bacterium]